MKLKILNFLVLLTMFISVKNIEARDNFRNSIKDEIKECSIDYKKYENGDELPNEYTTNMTELEYKRSECYLLIGNKIIDKFYSQDKENAKLKWKAYVQNTIDTNFWVKNNKDNCIPQCGTLSQLTAIYDANEEIYKKLQYLIDEVTVAG